MLGEPRVTRPRNPAPPGHRHVQWWAGEAEEGQRPCSSALAMTLRGPEAEIFIQNEASSGESVVPFLLQAGRPPARSDSGLGPSFEVQTPGLWPQGLRPDREPSTGVWVATPAHAV